MAADQIMKSLATALIAFAVVGSPALAQDDDFDPRKAVKEIKKDLDSVLENLSSLQGDAVDPKTGERIVENMDKLLDGMQKSQDRIVDNIDKILENWQMSQSSSSSGQGEQKQQKPQQGQDQKQQKRSDRNQQPKDQQREDQQDQKGEKPQNQPKGGEDQRKPEQSETGKKPPESGTEKIAVMRDAAIWGRLPAEVRQRLIERAYREFYPNYEKEIADYLKSVNKKKR